MEREDTPVTSRDRKNFTEDEFKRELALHHVNLEKGQLASAVYRRQPDTVTGRARSGVFRDFAEYGVHPARVVVQRFPLTVPFLVSSLTALQLADEITNQKSRAEKKKPDTKWEEEEEALARDIEIMPQGRVRNAPSVNAAYELITTIRKRKNYIDWTEPMQHYMSALNFYTFRMGGPNKIPARFSTPSRQRAAVELVPLIPPKIAAEEIEERELKDPGRWGLSGTPKITIADIASLVGELMTETSYTSEMREIIGWYKTAYFRSQITALLENVLNHQGEMIVTLRVRTSLVAAASQ